MKNYVLHGENQPESRRKLSDILRELENEGWETQSVDWHNVDKSELLSLCRSQSLISSGIVVAVENFFTGNKKATETIKELLKNKGDTTLVFWEGKVISPTALRNLKDSFTVQEFKIPVYIFKFLSSLIPGNASGSLKLMNEVVKKDSADFLFVMLARHIKLLIWAKLDPESLLVQSWQKGDLVKQASKFRNEALLELHSSLLEIDRHNKKSQLPEDLRASLDLLVASL